MISAPAPSSNGHPVFDVRKVRADFPILHTTAHGKPLIYLDNGATYRGDMLKTACARLGITLQHAKPYDPQARGKMERFWRTLRDGLLNYLGDVASLAEINRRLQAFLDKRPPAYRGPGYER